MPLKSCCFYEPIAYPGKRKKANDPDRVKDDATSVHLCALPVSALCKTLIDLPVLPILSEKEITCFNPSLLALIDRL